MRRLAHALIAAGFALAATIGVGAAQTGPDEAIPAKISEQIVADLAGADLDAFAADAAKYMAQNATDRIKNNFASIKDLNWCIPAIGERRKRTSYIRSISTWRSPLCAFCGMSTMATGTWCT